MDEIDRKILEELQTDAKLTNVELAARVGLSPSPCLARVRQLETSGIINQYVALLNPEHLGPSISVFIQITLDRQAEPVLEKFERNVSKMPEVMECYLITGDADYLLRVVVPDTVALKDFIIDKLSKLPGVANIRSGFALKQVKYQTAYPLRQILRQ